MAIKDNESCGSRVVDSATTSGRLLWKKLEVYNEVLRRLKEESNNHEALQPDFDDELWAHFNRLPTRYNFTFLSLSSHYSVHHLRFIRVGFIDDK